MVDRESGLASLDARAPDYDLSDEQMASQVGGLILRATKANNYREQKYSVHSLGPDDEFVNVARTVECDVFSRKFDNGPDLMEVEYEPYEGESHFYTVIDNVAKMAVGAMRIAGESDAGFKTIVDLGDSDKVKLSESFGGFDRSQDSILESHGIITESTIDILTLAMPRGVLGTRTSMGVLAAMYYEVYDYTTTNRISHWLTMFDERAKRSTDNIGVPFRSIGGLSSVEYLGSSGTLPLWLPTADIEPSMQDKKEHPKTRSLFKGMIDGMLGGSTDLIKGGLQRVAI